ncbi:hypothetical protein CLV28_2975 [Sediminihabitans luteus]|uniref:S1 motif domain-containing protein n=1 Tax=Sediminihabitans luteus TaxID=1138585 RepID=A0A2M9CBV4_9CELL|nr:hypothetical protein [Sediminihabitans luteus]PJJ68559.1 hypothetical protein CLV28_2975 [Sediminihabitans luteus]GII99894.1 hypothetical protein Slu03_22720 [Sediminihabitans luteus]
MPTATAVTSAVTWIRTADDATALARDLTVPGRRTRPVVVITIPSGETAPFVDPEHVHEALGDLADVVVMPTSDVSWDFSHHMPPGTQVYGGSARVYPVDHRWVSDLRRTPLRFAYGPDTTHRIADRLVQDALAAALDAGLVGTTLDVVDRPAQGTVRGLLDGRAFVALDDGMATVWQELTVPGITLDRLLREGQRVRGTLDPASRRLDVRASLAAPPAPGTSHPLLADYTSGAVVLARVADVGDLTLTLEVLPGVTAVVKHHLVTGNVGDHLSDLFTVGETVAARVDVHHAGELSMRLDDVDDDEPVLPAPSLLPGGPAWLELPPPSVSDAAAGAGPSGAVRPGPGASEPGRAGSPGRAPEPGPKPGPPGATRRPSPGPVPTDRGIPAARPGPAARPTPGRPRVTPRMLDPNAPRPAPAPAHGPTSAAPSATTQPTGAPSGATEPSAPSTSSRAATRTLSLALATERARADAAERELEILRAAERARTAELEALRANADALAREVEDAQRKVENQRARHRRVVQQRDALAREIKSGPGDVDRDVPTLFLDPEQQLRHEVYVTWAERVPASEKQERPLPEYAVGPDFVVSLDEIEGVSRAKVLEVVVDVLTGDRKRLSALDDHPLRTHDGSSAPPRRRDDGAVCYRVYLQRNTAQARRLHYWRLGGAIELARVVLHDDTRA